MSKLPKYIEPTPPSKKGRNFEKKLRNTINSGTLWFDPGDLSGDQWLIQSKITENKSYSLKEEDLLELFQQALRMKKEPIFIIQFQKLRLIGRVELV